MKRTLWVTAATIALMAGMNAASAQMGGQNGGGGDQPRMQNSPSGGATSKGEEKVKPGVHEKEPGAAVQRDQKEKSKLSQGQDRGQEKGQVQTQGGNREKIGRDEKSEKTEKKMGRDEKMEQKERTTQQGTQKNQVQSQDQKQGTQQGAQQGTSGSTKSVQLSTEQRSKIRTTLINSKVGRVNNVNFSIRVGARVPRTVHFYPLPVEIVEIVPEYRDYDYIIVGDEILIIDPNTLEIVAILPA
jgi:uncharacterized protein DUF1236